ncbi:histone deacetylase family protein [Candidatus Uabimicrobium amorphum]|uniref:Histone deacetylase n=1 Tax=Uabimicrobium amorphum TaxID=2596890 RepID=A0A5S9F6A5_UABAM|nr:histone deacetylase [Candidatus Uabimicrobium amorphum]BBM87696.1 histone deacetylase [Candidatus Uabimicrobium amorphum]
MSIPFVYHPIYSVPFPAQHRFRMAKFRLLYEKLLQKNIIHKNNVLEPQPVAADIIEISHSKEYIDAFFNNKLDKTRAKKLGLPWSEQLAARTKYSIAGTLLTTELALQHGIACHLAGGTHHSHFDFGSGFCIFNDLTIAALTLVKKQLADVIFILDCDVHQGDGTATILQEYPNIFTCSIHCRNNFPLKKTESDLDIPLEKDIGDAEYLEALQLALHKMLEIEPDLVIYDAGVDVHVDDALGKLAMTSQGIAARDYLVMKTCHEHHIPVATVIGGGYHKDLDHLVERHCIVHEQAAKFA